MYAPAFGKRTLTALSFSPSGRPLVIRVAPLTNVLPKFAFSRPLSKPSSSRLVNQNGIPASSLTLSFLPVGETSGSGVPPVGGRSTVWKPTGSKETKSPAWMRTVLGKNALTSLPVFSNALAAVGGTPMNTLFFAACAASGTTSASATAAQSVHLSLEVIARASSVGARSSEPSELP